jgi:hypothetical protein
MTRTVCIDGSIIIAMILHTLSDGYENLQESHGATEGAWMQQNGDWMQHDLGYKGYGASSKSRQHKSYSTKNYNTAAWDVLGPLDSTVSARSQQEQWHGNSATRMLDYSMGHGTGTWRHGAVDSLPYGDDKHSDSLGYQ